MEMRNPAQTVRGVPRSIEPAWLRVMMVSPVKFSARKSNETRGVSGTVAMASSVV